MREERETRDFEQMKNFTRSVTESLKLTRDLQKKEEDQSEILANNHLQRELGNQVRQKTHSCIISQIIDLSLSLSRSAANFEFIHPIFVSVCVC